MNSLVSVDEKTLGKLSTSLESVGFGADVKKISEKITRAEAGIIIMSVKNARTENARNKLTENLQGLLDRSFIKNIEGNRFPGGYDSRQTTFGSDERISEALQDWSSFPKEKERGNINDVYHHYELRVGLPGGKIITGEFIVPKGKGNDREFLSKKARATAFKLCTREGVTERPTSLRLSSRKIESREDLSIKKGTDKSMGI